MTRIRIDVQSRFAPAGGFDGQADRNQSRSVHYCSHHLNLVFGDQLAPKANEEPAAGIHLSKGRLSDGPQHTTAPGTPSDFAPPPESTSSTDKLGSAGKVLPPKFELEIRV